jgi:hypothetical protein
VKQGRPEYIKANFGCLPSNISRLQEEGVTLNNATDLVRNTKNALANVAGYFGKLVSSKLKRVLGKKHWLQSNVLYLPDVNGRIIQYY